MIKVLKATDRIPVKIGDVTIKLAPLTYRQKTDISNSLSTRNGEKVMNYADATFKVIKYSLKEVEGIKYYDDSEFELRFEGESLTDDCVDELLNAEIAPSVTNAAFALLNGYTDEITDPVTGEKIEGVEIMPVESATVKK